MIKQSKGITLVALVITIIILLILAGVSIMALTESGLFEEARQAEQKSENAQIQEETTLADYENRIGEYVDSTREGVKLNNTILLNGKNTMNVPADTWTILEEVSLNGYGTGKAIITYSVNLSRQHYCFSNRNESRRYSSWTRWR